MGWREGLKHLEVDLKWLGKSGTVLHGSVAPVISEHLLSGADTRLPPGDTEQRKVHMTSLQTHK